MLGRALPTAVCVVVLAVITAASGYATTVTGTENPHFRVRVSITPAHPAIGQTIVARFSITNTTGHRLNGEWQFTWSTPQSGIGAAIAGTLAPGRLAGETIRRKVTATTAKGRYVIYAEASDGRGSSHARAIATLR